jgi:hypothetical protein
MTVDDALIQKAITDLKVGFDGTAVAIFDHRTAQIQVSTEARPDAFWNAFTGFPCLPVDWAAWYRELWAAGEHHVTCGCGDRHQLYGLVLLERWVLLIVTRGLLVPDGGSFEAKVARSYAEEVLILRFLLEEKEAGRRRPGAQGQGGGGSGPAELAIPLWWKQRAEE